MSKIPRNPKDIFEQFTNDYKGTFAEDLISIILYGSSARGEYVYKKSDINFLIVLTDQGIEQLQKALPLIKRWHKRKVSTPLILTLQYIQSSLDSFPIEFFTMKQHYEVVYGENIFADIEIKLKDLRLQCEREIRSKLLHLRESYLNTVGNKSFIKQILQVSLPTFTSIFSALLHLKEKEVPSTKLDVFKLTEKEFDLDYTLFEKIIMLKDNKIKLNKEQLNQLMRQYINQIRHLTNIVDKL